MKTRILFIILLSSIIFFARADNFFTKDNPDPKYDRLQKELDRYYDIEKNGGWKKIVLTKKYFMRGQSSPEIKQVKERMRASGDFNSDDDSPVFTEELYHAIKKVQKSFGEVETGSIDANLIKDLNVPVEKRVEQLQVNLERLRTIHKPTEGIRLVANIPEFKLHVYDGTKEVFDMAIVVGREGKETVTFNDEMKYIIFSPYWNVPPSIVKEEILPTMHRDKNYMRNNGYEIVGNENGLPVIRQKPGPENSLGLIKFVFPNNYGIYFHDTPVKQLFKLNKRTFSHGCIRLEKPVKLAEYLLRSKGWTTEKIETAMKAGKEQKVNLPKPVPVNIIYLTSWVDDDGTLNFRDDIYGLDKEAAKKMMRTAKL